MRRPLLDRVTGDHMGMLATVMNGLALRDALGSNIQSHVMSAIYEWCGKALRHRQQSDSLPEQGEVVIFAAGTGNPFHHRILRRVCAVGECRLM